MKSDKTSFRLTRRQLIFGAAAILFIALGVYIFVPHRSQTIEAHSALQTGIKMDVRLVVESPWGWLTPTRLVGMDVAFGGRKVPMARDAYDGLSPLDVSRKVVIAEKDGSPEVIVRGLPQSKLTLIRWRFLNYSFSERDVLKHHDQVTTFYNAPEVPPKQVRLANLDSTHLSVFSGTVFAPKKAPAKDLK